MADDKRLTDEQVMRRAMMSFALKMACKALEMGVPIELLDNASPFLVEQAAQAAESRPMTEEETDDIREMFEVVASKLAEVGSEIDEREQFGFGFGMPGMGWANAG